ncbi:MAG TPA: GntR family transcriptional regulator [Burkholderiales bacterium]|nr:GntR family transcriptional regulator [Burkholderiales bacterium]
MPLYRDIKRDLTQRIAAAEWLPGGGLPSEAKLAAHYGVAIGTLRKAIDELVAERIVQRRQGSGTYVGTHHSNRLLFHFFHIVPRVGGRRAPTTRTLAFRRAKALAHEARRLHIRTGAPVFRVRNLLSLGGQPVVLDELVLPQHLFPDLSEGVLTGRGNTIYHLYHARFGVNVLRTTERLRAVRADAVSAKALGVKARSPLLHISRTALSYDDAPVELRESLVNTTNHDYFSDLGKPEPT